MLTPNSRELLLDALRPEPGYVLDQAVGTTYTLDLDALLFAPLAFALFDVDAGHADPDPIALLATISAYAHKMAIYTDGGKISAPPRGRPLTQLIEKTIHPVHMVDGGAFHPKVWVLRFVTSAGEYRHRALVLSRNLTFDRSWDTVLRLDEDPEGTSENAIELAQFLQSLGRRSPSEAVSKLLETLGTVSFAPPAGFDTAQFWPLAPGASDPMAGVDTKSMLVISPFATSGRLGKMAPGAKRRALVTRADTLNELGGHVLDPWDEVYVLHGEAVDGVEEDRTMLSGLHAKVHVFDDGKQRRVFTGSANATTAAFGTNVELIVELTSTDPVTRVDRLLELSDKETTLRSLLVARRPEKLEPATQTPEELEAERLEEVARGLASQHSVARARTDDAGRWVVDFELPTAGTALAPSDSVQARLVTAGGAWQPLTPEDDRFHAPLAAGAASKVTSLIAIEVKSGSGLDVNPETFVVVAELLDAPPDREQQLLLDLLPDAEKLMRLLFMLLADARDDGDAAAQVRKMLSLGTAGETAGWTLQLPLFENLVRTFAREPERLRSIKRIIDQVRKAEDAIDRFPPGFLELWQTFDSAMPKEPKR